MGRNLQCERAGARESTVRWPETDFRVVAQLFARCGLPYREPKPGTQAWIRRNGAWTLTVQPGMTDDEDGNPVSIGFPFGTIPRLISVWMSTEVMRTHQQELVLGESLTDFMDAIGIKGKTGGAKGTITKLKDQAERLFQSTVSVRYDGDDDLRVGARTSVATRYSLWTNKKPGGQLSLMPSTVLLSQEFYDECLANPVPIDMNTLTKLRGSPMRLDIYVWLTHRMSYVREFTDIPWSSLMVQFGSNYAPGRQGQRKFKLDFAAHLEKVLQVYDGANAIATEYGVTLGPGRTDIPTRQAKALTRMAETDWRQSSSPMF